MTKPDAEPTGGWFEAGAHVLPLRVYYEDTDFSGVVYHASYLRFMERGRSEFLRLSGLRHQGMLTAEEPLVWVVRRLSIEYIKPARVDDSLRIRTRVEEVTGARLKLAQTVLREAEELVAAVVEVCVVTLDGRLKRVPDDIRKKLEALSQR
jgi:acyl-CoA thioester hydrolase